MLYRFGGLAVALGLVLAVVIGVALVEKQRANHAIPAPAEAIQQPAMVQTGVATEQNEDPVAEQAEQTNPADEGVSMLQAEPTAEPLSPEEASADAAPAEAAVPPVSVAGQPTPAEPEVDQLIEVLETSPANSADDSAAADPASPDQPMSAESEGVAVTSNKPIVPEPELDWYEDYREAYRAADEEGRMLLIYFYETQSTTMRRWFDEQVLTDPGIKAKLADYVLLRLPLDAVISKDGHSTTLLRHASFGEMQGRSGIAIIDLAHRKANYYKYVVSTFPFMRGRYYRGPVVDAILSLPPGTLTQRTMIYAVRTHPEKPASTQGSFHNVLAEEAKLQSDYQARILVQGHHNWDSRFQRINARVGTTAQEVVAESWPNENLLDACVDCVDSWRQSPGHWSAVRSRHPIFGFDIKRGKNGIWYATGIFGRR